jgi:lipoprotein-anchoring transpeptidase ErfK/SrfK
MRPLILSLALLAPTLLAPTLLVPTLLALAGPAEAGPRSWPRAEPVDPYEDEAFYEPEPYGRPRGVRAPAPPVYRGGPYGGGPIEMLMTGRDPTPYGYGRPVPVDPYTGEPIGVARPRRGAVAAIPPSYAFEPETEGLGLAVDPAYRRQLVAFRGAQRPGTIVIDTPNRFLYLVQPGGAAIRYGIGVGRPGFTWAGVKTVSMKREWPDWRPPAEMLRRRPDLPRHMEGGPDNPLGARALYLGSSLFRIHGTNEPHTIGRSVSSGCIRMLNEDVVDLYNRVRVGTRVVVI